MAMITVDDYLDAFKEMCDYDEIDAKHFGSESLEAIIRDDIKSRLEDGLMFTKEALSKVVEDALYSIQYGDTVDANDLAAINKDFHNRFPDGR